MQVIVIACFQLIGPASSEGVTEMPISPVSLITPRRDRLQAVGTVIYRLEVACRLGYHGRPN